MARAKSFLTVLIGLVWGSGLCAQTADHDGWSLDRHVMVLGADSDRVYLGVSPKGLTLDEAMRTDWAVHSAPRTGGDLVQERLRPRSVPAWEGLNGLQHVSMHPSGHKALLSAQREGGDLDVFLSHRTPARVPGGKDVWSAPMPLDGLNSEADEVLPRWEGGDVVFASNRAGAYRLFRSRAALQYLRAEPWDVGLEGELVSSVTVGPSFTWVSQRNEGTGLVEVVRARWPQPVSPLPQGWSVCLQVDGETGANHGLSIRDVSTGEVVRTMTLGPDGCAALDGLPSDKAWTMRWEGSPEGQPREPGTVVAEVRAPDGRVVRRYELSAKKGWAFVMLPLDPLTELQGAWHADASAWPTSTWAMLTFDRGNAMPTQESREAFEAWAAEWHPPQSGGHWEVVGHTDDSGSDQANRQLSQDRAQGVADRLMEVVRCSPSNVVVLGEGSDQPLGKIPAQNRRVEVRWVPSMQ